MRKNRWRSAKELENYINLYLINGKSYRKLKASYGLELNSKNCNKYVNMFRVHGSWALVSKATTILTPVISKIKSSKKI